MKMKLKVVSCQLRTLCDQRRHCWKRPLVDWMRHVTRPKPHMTLCRFGRGLRCFADKRLEAVTVNKSCIFYYTLSFWSQDETTMLLWIVNTSSQSLKEPYGCSVINKHGLVVYLQSFSLCVSSRPYKHVECISYTLPSGSLISLSSCPWKCGNNRDERSILVCYEITICNSSANCWNILDF